MIDAAPEVFGCPGRCGRPGVATLTACGWVDGLCDECWRLWLADPLNAWQMRRAGRTKDRGNIKPPA